jgi:hydroxyacylglutathione hydrolase
MDINCLKLSVTNCYLLKVKDGYLLVDTGYESDLNIFKQELQKNSVDIKDIQYIFLTHHHNDHSGLVNFLVESNNSIRVIMHKYVAEALLTGKNVDLSRREKRGVPNRRVRFFVVIRKRLMPSWTSTFPVYKIRDIDIIVEEKNVNALPIIGIGGKIIYTPGHTKGDISLILDDGSCFCGDSAMNNPIVNILGAQNMTIGIEDLDVYYNSWLTLLANGSTTIYPAHGNPFKAKKLKQNIGRIKTLVPTPDIMLKY